MSYETRPLHAGEDLKRSFQQFAQSDPSTSQPTQRSDQSPETRRRKFKRRKGQIQRRLEEQLRIAEIYTHISVIGTRAPYAQLRNELTTADADPVIVEYCKENPPADETLTSDNWTFVKANTLVEMNHLKNFDRPVRVMPDQHTDIIMRAANIVADLLELPQLLRFPLKGDIQDVPFKGDKFAGMEYADMGMKTRKEADPVAQQDAEWAYDRLLAGHHVSPHDVRLGGRGKVTQHKRTEVEQSPPAVGRLILMLSQRDLKLCGITEKLLTSAYLDAKWPISVGDSWFHEGTHGFYKRFRNYTNYYCLDAKKYDAFLDPWLIKIAINIIREQFVDGREPAYDAYWRFVEESLISAPICRDDGIRLQKNVGTTSGHSHNTLLQSICTLIVGYGVFISLNPELSDAEIKSAVHMESLGDDNISATKDPLPEFSVEQIAGKAWDIFGIDWFGKKSFATTAVVDVTPLQFQGVQYLGKYFRREEYPTEDGPVGVVIPYRPFGETFLRLLYPEYGTLDVEQTWLRVLGNYIDAAGNPVTERWLQGLLDWLEPQVEATFAQWPSNFLRMVSRDYTGVGVEVPRPERMSYEQWRDLVVLPRSEYKSAWKAEEEEDTALYDPEI
ncbi:putative RdRp [Penicillium aurantiogriseum bipartite virus 1]|uniref:putative RdRp n=1 Tax=Penicillium aurantiogriseum bipartite virus 1 TaxID=1755754 RepID=UPI00071AE12E|nr:putative RdRp [Penicillium aurantiogriseum bipartite virus 1]ALO50128.1 putative RdRp [Penicillium aurantiogriseum bipartite virus 1]